MEKLLVVIDVQNDFVTDALKNDEAICRLPNVVKAVERAAAAGTDIWFTRDTHHQNYMETQEGANLPVPHCLMGTKGWEIVDELKPYADKPLALTFDKPTFGSVALATEISKHADLKEVTLIGYCTDICVVSNALLIKAFNPELKIRVIEECCAGVSEETHNAALKTMETCQIEIDRTEY